MTGCRGQKYRRRVRVNAIGMSGYVIGQGSGKSGNTVGCDDLALSAVAINCAPSIFTCSL
jgi:hypothetical protein